MYYNVFKIHNKLHWTRMMTLQLLIKMHALEAQGSEQKRKACINFTHMNLFYSKWYCNGNTLPHNWNLWSSYVIILVQCNFFMIFQSIVIPVLYHKKFPKFVCNVIDLHVCKYMYHLRSNYKNRLEFIFNLVIQWNLVRKRSDITKPFYNKVILLVPPLYISLFFHPDIMRNLI